MLGQSYVIGKIFGKAAEGIARMNGESPEGAKECGKAWSMIVGGIVGVATFDAAGAAGFIADASTSHVTNSLTDAGNRFIENGM